MSGQRAALLRDGQRVTMVLLALAALLSSGCLSAPPPENRPAVARIAATITEVATGTEVVFDGSGSEDDSGISGYAWEFGDGARASGPVASHAYAADGRFDVMLMVTATDGDRGNATLRVTVMNRAPTAAIDSDWTRPPVGVKVRFDGSRSQDDQAISAYAWDFGDGSAAAGVTADHAYSDDGNFTVTLTVVDDDGAQGKTSAAVQVMNSAPKPVLKANRTDAPVGIPFRFDGSASSDDQGVAAHLWSFGDSTSGAGTVVDHAYSAVGNYTVSLEVEDTDGVRASAAITVRVTVPGNKPPQAVIVANRTDVKVGELFGLNGSSSSDDKGIVAFWWEFGDGSNASGALASHSYSAPGLYMVALTVTDTDGATGSTSVQVTARTDPPPSNCTAGSVTLGTILSYSGLLGNIANSIKRGAQVAVQDVNSGGCVQGKKLVLDTMGDDRLDQSTAVQVYRSMLAKGHKGVIGSMASSVTQAVINDNEQSPSGMVVVSPASTAALLTQNNAKRFFRTLAHDGVQGPAAATHVVDILGKKKVGLLYQDEITGQGMRASFQPALQAKGGSIVAEAKFPPGSVAFSQEVATVLGATPEVVVMFAFFKEQGYLVDELRNQGWSGPILGTADIENKEIFNIVPATKLEGVQFTRHYANLSGPSHVEFVNNHTLIFGVPPEAFADLGYDAVMVLVETLRALGTSATTDQMATHIRSTVFLRTITGGLDFDQNGDILGGAFVIYQIKGGKFVPYR